MANPLTRGDRAIAFIENFCKIPSGAKVGQQIKLEKFQKDFIRAVLDNPTGTRRAYLSIGLNPFEFRAGIYLRTLRPSQI
jgi:hypothetical protein